MSNLRINSKFVCILILAITLLVHGQISCLCTPPTDEERKQWNEEMGERPAHLEKWDREQKEIAERERIWALLIERAALRKDGAPEDYINEQYPLPGSESQSKVNPEDLPTQTEELVEGGNEDAVGGDSGYGY